MKWMFYYAIGLWFCAVGVVALGFARHGLYLGAVFMVALLPLGVGLWREVGKP